MIILTTFDERKEIYVNRNLIESVFGDVYARDGSPRYVSVVTMSSGCVHIVNERVDEIVKAVAPDSKIVTRWSPLTVAEMKRILNSKQKTAEG